MKPILRIFLCAFAAVVSGRTDQVPKQQVKCVYILRSLVLRGVSLRGAR